MCDIIIFLGTLSLVELSAGTAEVQTEVKNICSRKTNKDFLLCYQDLVGKPIELPDKNERRSKDYRQISNQDIQLFSTF